MYNPPKCQNTHTTRPCHLLGTAQVFPSLYLGIWYLTVDSLLAVDLAAGVPLSFLRPPANTQTADTAYLLRQAGWTPTASSHCWILWIKPSVALDTASSNTEQRRYVPELLPTNRCYGNYRTFQICTQDPLSSFPPQSKDQKDTQFGIWAEIQR